VQQEADDQYQETLLMYPFGSNGSSNIPIMTKEFDRKRCKFETSLFSLISALTLLADLNLDLINIVAYDLRYAAGKPLVDLKKPIGGKDGIRQALENGIFINHDGNAIQIELPDNVFADFETVLRYAEDFGGREFGVAKIKLPKTW